MLGLPIRNTARSTCREASVSTQKSLLQNACRCWFSPRFFPLIHRVGAASMGAGGVHAFAVDSAVSLHYKYILTALSFFLRGALSLDVRLLTRIAAIRFVTAPGMQDIVSTKETEERQPVNDTPCRSRVPSRVSPFSSPLPKISLCALVHRRLAEPAARQSKV